MAYCTTADIVDVLSGTLGGLPGDASELTDSQLTQAVTDAQTEIDLALSALYITPLDPVPDPIKQICINIACYLADLTYRMSKDYGANANPLRLRYARARLLLDGIVSGQYSLNVDDSLLLTSGGVVVNPYCGDLITTNHLFGPAIHGSMTSPVGNVIFSIDDITKVEVP